MIRILLSVAALFLAVLAFDWLGGVPVAVSVSWPGGAAAPPLRVVVVALLVLAVVLTVVWKLASGLWRAPSGLRAYFAGRRRDRGYRALSRGMIAVGSGDYRLAQREAAEAHRYLDGEPLGLLLAAQAAQLEGRSDAARQAFTRMLKAPETRLLGLRGLYIEATRAGETAAARQFAAEAQKENPALPWAGAAMMDYLSADRSWADALAVLEQNVAGRLIGKDEAARLRAALLTARALEIEDGEPDKARAYALEAHKLAPAFVPAATVAARTLARALDTRRAAKVLEATWRLAPHPELAAAYLHLRSGDSARDRLKRARMLENLKPVHPEGAVTVARAALDAREFGLAREALAKALRQAPTERVCLMMAELEESESGDVGRVREWLARAVRAPRDAAWTADGLVLDAWQPLSPLSGRLDAVEWRVPAERDAIHQIDGDDLAVIAAAPRPVVEPPPMVAAPPAPEVVTEVPPPVPEPEEPPAPILAEPEPAETPPAVEPAPEVPPPDDRPVETKPVIAAKSVEVRPAAEPLVVLPPPPDDPGPANGRGLARSLTPQSPFS
jgi:HemY protein